MHALVNNNTVVRTGDVPTAWTLKDGQSVSGFNLWTNAQIKPEGWYPVTEQRATLAANQHHGPPVYTVRADDVLASYAAVADEAPIITARDIDTKLRDALAPLQTIIDSPLLATGSNLAATVTAVRDCQQAIKVLARNQRRLILRARADYSTGSD